MADDPAWLAWKREINARFMDLVPHNRALGVEVLGLAEGEARMRLPYDPKLVGNPESGVLHGGAVSSLLDACCGAAVFMKLREPSTIATLDLRIDYMKLAAPERAVDARAVCFKATRNVAFVRAFAYHDDEADPMASAVGAFMLATPPGSPRGWGVDEPAAAALPPPEPEPTRTAAPAPAASPAVVPASADALRAELAATIAAFRERRDPRLLTSAIPYARFLGLEVLCDPGGGVVGKLAFADHLIGNRFLPALHGGTVGALLEFTAIFHVLWEADTVVLPKTINITVDYLRPGRPVDTWARGTITRTGRRVVNVRAEAWQDDPAKPIALASAHFLVVPLGD
jgi:uncharacterized protein (TIGR00369 family)